MPVRPQHILHVALAVPVRRCFDYLPGEKFSRQVIKPGTRLQVPFGNTQTRTGILLNVSDKSEIKAERLKPITSIIDEQPILSVADLRLKQWASDYYHHPIGETLFSTLPVLLRQGKSLKRKVDYLWQLSDAGKTIDFDALRRAPNQQAFLQLLRENPEGIPATQPENRKFYSAIKALQEKGLIKRSEYTPVENNSIAMPSPVNLNADQLSAANSIKSHLGKYQQFLLNGVTGSGKTEVYIEIIKQLVSEGKQALVLVPEIGLTPQLINRIKDNVHAKLVVLHSALSDNERLQAWLQARDGIASVVLGTRSAIWTPLKNPGVLIVDEEHDLSYKQQDGFRYSARDVAIMRGKMDETPVVLGSATPSMETLQNVRIGKFKNLRLPSRAGNAVIPSIQIINMRGKRMRDAFSQTLLDAISNEISNKRQVLLFLNRRGFSPLVMCHSCAWVAKCKRCDINMTYHKHNKKLCCHHCGSQSSLPQTCPQCNADELLQLGHGTERLTETLAEIFPDARIIRIDRDSTRRKDTMQKMLNSINDGQADILIGTQMLAKGHHFPNLSLVGIIDADQGLFSTDFRASERMGQLFIQVSGRAGRVDRQGTVLIQTHYPDHPLLQSLVTQGYNEFAEMLLTERQQTRLPPFSYMALLRAEDYSAEATQYFLQKARAMMLAQTADIEIFGPIPAPMEKRAGRLRYQLLLQCSDRGLLRRQLGPWIRQLETLPSGRKVRWSLDVDPQDML